jgi:hypothetical protein
MKMTSTKSLDEVKAERSRLTTELEAESKRYQAMTMAEQAIHNCKRSFAGALSSVIEQKEKEPARVHLSTGPTEEDGDRILRGLARANADQD